MAEAMLAAMSKRRFQVRSAGAHPRDRVHPLAIAAMDEVGINIRNHYPKPVHIFKHDPVKVAICVCDEASAACAAMPAHIEKLHWPIPDPAKATGNEEEQLRVFREVRELLHEKIREWLSQQQ
jgi:arsenate reductase